jgi:hypothetical protein
MIQSTTEVLDAGKRELTWKRSPRANADKKNLEQKTCKHLAPGGWCSKKQQRCPLLDLHFINQ